MKRNIIILAILILILIFLSFMWNESIKLNEKVNHQKITNFFIILFTFSGTIATIYYTYKQYKLSESKLKPEIYPIRMQFFEMIDINFPIDGNEQEIEYTITNNANQELDINKSLLI